jgi:hypothetical protein
MFFLILKVINFDYALENALNGEEKRKEKERERTVSQSSKSEK